MIPGPWATTSVARKQMLWASRILFVAAIVSVVVLSATGHRVGVDVGGAPLVFVLLATHAGSAAQLLYRNANLQAALDMKRILLKAAYPGLVTQRLRVRAGEPFELIARDGTKFVITSDISTAIKVEYKG